MRPFVESLARLYPNRITEEIINELLRNKKIDEEEHRYILLKSR